MVNKKDRRHDGRRTVVVYDTQEFPEEVTYWNDWAEWRDGMRGYDDKTSLRSPHMWCAKWLNVKRWNKKIKLLLSRRKAMKHGRMVKQTKKHK